MPFDFRTVKMLKRPITHDPRVPHFTKYLKTNLPGGLPLPPFEIDNTYGITYPDYHNSGQGSIGDCVEAAVGNGVLTWSTLTKNPVELPYSAILDAYEVVGGYDPTNPLTDLGTDPLQLLSYWLNTGIGGNKCDGFAYIDPDRMQAEVATTMYGGFICCLNLPVSAQLQTFNGPWAVPSGGPVGEGAPGSWGGHCVFIVGYNVAKGIACTTWQGLQWMTWGFWKTYTNVNYVVTSDNWIGANGLSPSNFDQAALVADMQRLSQPYSPYETKGA